MIEVYHRPEMSGVESLTMERLGFKEKRKTLRESSAESNAIRDLIDVRKKLFLLLNRNVLGGK